ncbi:histidine kinase,HAMP domain-containing protein,histidine kinase [Rivularia sp. PCC 7116]|uniref:sensor histidine kinase n=1 Tax=Rivularia sp. PCC 7116 TaxID=373994 RepID=UPI00029F0567|nr:ATP-binding protein [Rivularia sp. PCC 7116]AFY58093.1 histidine kinase,HAMP domain-containing protein,histidine kinase [Rivularia sp. PCC 7116]
MNNNKILRWWFNLSIQGKQLIGLFASEVISVFGLVGVGAFLIVIGGRSVLVNQAKSELAVTEINYNIKIDQMGFGFRGQSDNAAIIAAAKAHKNSQFLNSDLQKRVKKILENEIEARNIEYATLVGKDLRIITNANNNRNGEIFNPNNLVSEAFKTAEQIKSSEIVSWKELNKESPPLLSGLEKQEALIRYTITPVSDPKTKEILGALISGDIVNYKLPIVNKTLAAINGGYSAVYSRSNSDIFKLATSALNVKNKSGDELQPTNKNKYLERVALPKNTILSNAVKARGKAVTQRIKIKEKNYTIAAKSIKNFKGEPVAILVQGTPETALNILLQENLMLQFVIAALALLIDIGLAILLGRTIANPIKKLQITTHSFTEGNLEVRVDISSKDEIGELASSFNSMAQQLALREKTNKEQMQQLEAALAKIKQNQTHLIQTEKMSALGQMVAGVAHEINNPVSFVYGNINYAKEYIQDLLGLLQLYQQEYPNPTSSIKTEIEAIDLEFLQEDLPKMLDSMEIGAERIIQIVNSLRNFSRLDEAEIKAVDIHEGIDSTLVILANKLKNIKHKSAIQIIKEYQELPLVECYANQLNQVFMNILSNAIDALEDSAKDNLQIFIRTQIQENNVIIGISDNGSGIDREAIENIFNPFFTTKAVGKGTGLGLSISHQIITEKHKGKISCTSTLGEGTEFLLTIPIEQRITNS